MVMQAVVDFRGIFTDIYILVGQVKYMTQGCLLTLTYTLKAEGNITS